MAKNAKHSSTTEAERRAHRVSVISLVVSIASAVFAAKSFQEAREARVDAIRTRVKAEALAGLTDARTAVAQFNCYLAVRGKLGEVGPEKAKIEAVIAQGEPKVRDWLKDISSRDESALLAFEKGMQSSEISPSQQLKEVLLQARATWSKEEIERADAVCKI